MFSNDLDLSALCMTSKGEKIEVEFPMTFEELNTLEKEDLSTISILKVNSNFDLLKGFERNYLKKLIYIYNIISGLPNYEIAQIDAVAQVEGFNFLLLTEEEIMNSLRDYNFVGFEKDESFFIESAQRKEVVETVFYESNDELYASLESFGLVRYFDFEKWGEDNLIVKKVQSLDGSYLYMVSFL